MRRYQWRDRGMYCPEARPDLGWGSLYPGGELQTFQTYCEWVGCSSDGATLSIQLIRGVKHGGVVSNVTEKHEDSS